MASVMAAMREQELEALLMRERQAVRIGGMQDRLRTGTVLPSDNGRCGMQVLPLHSRRGRRSYRETNRLRKKPPPTAPRRPQ